MKLDRSGSFHLIVIGRDMESEPCAVRACPPHLDADVWRLPGESVAGLVNRAKQLAVGQGVAVTTLVYAEDVRH
jgi:hypothetical protein